MLAFGRANVPLVNQKNPERYLIDFTIVDRNFTPLLGLKTDQQMKLLTVQKQNILSLGEDMPCQDVKKPKFTKEAALTEFE